MTAAAALAALLLLAAAPAKEKPGGRFPPLGDCRDDQGVDRCDPEKQRQVRALFGVRSIEAHRDAGDQVRRAFYVDGYGRDMVAIEFIRPKGADPMLWVHFAVNDAGKRTPPMTAAVDAVRWNDLLRRSEHFDREPQAREEATPKGEQEAIRMCLHGSIFTVEATDPADGETRPATLRRRTEDACDDGLTEAFATELAKMALPLLPPCALLDPKRHRNEAASLKSCGYLTGDRLAAAGVMNRIEDLRYIQSADDEARLAALFGSAASLDWTGEAKPDGEAAAAFWLRKLREAEAEFYFDDIVGETAGRVRLRGGLYRRVGAEGGELEESAPVEMVWEEDGGDFEIERATVGAFGPVPKP